MEITLSIPEAYLEDFGKATGFDGSVTIAEHIEAVILAYPNAVVKQYRATQEGNKASRAEMAKESGIVIVK